MSHSHSQLGRKEWNQIINKLFVLSLSLGNRLGLSDILAKIKRPSKIAKKNVKKKDCKKSKKNQIGPKFVFSTKFHRSIFYCHCQD